MFCYGCYEDKPPVQFEKPGGGAAHSRYCHACRPGRILKRVEPSTPIITQPAIFKVGYGRDLFPMHVRMNGLAPVADRDLARAVGELYNANTR